MSTEAQTMKLHIKEKERRGHKGDEGSARRFQMWKEYQVKYKQAVLARFNLKKDAEQYIRDYQAYLRGEREKP
jgi:hypothetical protein